MPGGFCSCSSLSHVPEQQLVVQDPPPASPPVTALPQAGSHPGPAQGPGRETQGGTGTCEASSPPWKVRTETGGISVLRPRARTFAKPSATQCSDVCTVCPFPAPSSPTDTGPDGMSITGTQQWSGRAPPPGSWAHSAASFLPGRARLWQSEPHKARPGPDAAGGAEPTAPFCKRGACVFEAVHWLCLWVS